MKLYYIFLIITLFLLCSCTKIENEETTILTEGITEQKTSEISVDEKQESQVEKPPEIDEKSKENKPILIMFHNGQGPMCLEQLDFLEEIKNECPQLIVEEHLTTDPDTRPFMYELESQYEQSIGVSDHFGYLPITFVNNHAYSGFDDVVKEKLEQDIKEICK